LGYFASVALLICHMPMLTVSPSNSTTNAPRESPFSNKSATTEVCLPSPRVTIL
jgi:hypothetical protein